MSQLHTLRMIVATVAAVALVVSVAPAAEAHHRPREWCPEGGNWCLNVRMRDGQRVFYLFHEGDRDLRYRLCVTAPDSSRNCRRFRAEAEFGVATGWVVWREHFPFKGRGAYSVIWKRLNAKRIGRKLGFHVR